MNNNKSFVIALALILALIKLSNGFAITNPTQQNIILNKHNQKRREAANGQLSQYGFQTAAKMYPLTWDDTLANTANRLASSCSFNHNDFGTGNGQNIAEGNGYASAEAAITDLQNLWVGEQSLGPNALKHFSQMVDDDTFKVGCALENCGSGYYLVCNYDPAGNDIGSPVYEAGATGSKCPNGASNGLCSGSGSTQPSGSGDTSGNGNGNGAGNGGSSGSSTKIDVNQRFNELCAGNGGWQTQETWDGSAWQCKYTITCNDGRTDTFTQVC